jgi:hypothetical protein
MSRLSRRTAAPPHLPLDIRLTEVCVEGGFLFWAFRLLDKGRLSGCGRLKKGKRIAEGKRIVERKRIVEGKRIAEGK